MASGSFFFSHTVKNISHNALGLNEHFRPTGWRGFCGTEFIRLQLAKIMTTADPILLTPICRWRDFCQVNAKTVTAGSPKTAYGAEKLGAAPAELFSWLFRRCLHSNLVANILLSKEQLWSKPTNLIAKKYTTHKYSR